MKKKCHIVLLLIVITSPKERRGLILVFTAFLSIGRGERSRKVNLCSSMKANFHYWKEKKKQNSQLKKNNNMKMLTYGFFFQWWKQVLIHLTHRVLYTGIERSTATRLTMLAEVPRPQFMDTCSCSGVQQKINKRKKDKHPHLNPWL